MWSWIRCHSDKKNFRNPNIPNRKSIAWISSPSVFNLKKLLWFIPYGEKTFNISTIDIYALRAIYTV